MNPLGTFLTGSGVGAVGATFVVAPGAMAIPDVFPMGTGCSVLRLGDTCFGTGVETVVVVVVGLSLLW